LDLAVYRSCSTLARMNGLVPDRPRLTQTAGPATSSASSGRLTAGREATAAAEPAQAPAGWADLLAECAGLALGYSEHQADAALYRQIADLCIAAGVDQTLVEAWVEVGRQRATTVMSLTHKACVLAE